MGSPRACTGSRSRAASGFPARAGDPRREPRVDAGPVHPRRRHASARSATWRRPSCGRPRCSRARWTGFGTFPVDARRRRRGRDLGRGAALLADGELLGIFPQGTSQAVSAERPYHRGAARLALVTGAPRRARLHDRDRAHPAPRGRGRFGLPRVTILVASPIPVERARPTVAAAKALTGGSRTRSSSCAARTGRRPTLDRLMIDSYWLLFLHRLGRPRPRCSPALYLSSVRTRDATAVDAGWAGEPRRSSRSSTRSLAPGALAQRVLIATLVGLENAASPRSCNGARQGRGLALPELRARWRREGPRAAQLRDLLPGAGGCWPRSSACRSCSRASTATARCAASNGSAPRSVARRPPRSRQPPTGSSPRSSARPGEPRADDATAGLWRYHAHPNYFFQWLTVVRVRARRLARAVGLDRALRAGPHPLPDPLRDRHPALGAGVAAQPRRRLPPLPARDQRLRPMVSEASSTA